MSQIKPRHSVAYHFLNEEATRYSLYDNIRETYDGPLSMATDMMVWNITKDKITERMAVAPDNAWPVPGTTRQPPPEAGRPDVMSDFIKSGEWGPGFNAQNRMLDAHAKKFGIEKQDWRPNRPWYKPEP
jgi:ribonuclease Z